MSLFTPNLFFGLLIIEGFRGRGGRNFTSFLRFSGPFFQKNPRVRKILVRNSGAGNGCANFVGAWKNALFLQEKPMSIKFLLLRGKGYFGFWGECQFYFYGRGDFSDLWRWFEP